MDELVLEIAGVVAAIRAPAASLAPVRERCAAYAAAPRSPDLVLEVAPSPEFAPPAPPRAAHPVADCAAAGARFRYTRRDLVVDLDLGPPATARCRCVPHAAAVDNALKLCLATLLPFRRVLLLHGSAVRRRDRGYVFAGPSGAGKSTIVRLLAGDDDAVPLGDEIVAVALRPPGAEVLSTPFPGREATAPVPPAHAPLSRLYLLTPEPVDSAPARVARLLRNALVHGGTPELADAVLRNAEELLAGVEARALFRPGRDELLRALDG